ncbi:hypothetical protein [Aurantiacibacter gangjinensis]|nr:hypothetical protein [Aurantiacibacter gangjinensis]
MTGFRRIWMACMLVALGAMQSACSTPDPTLRLDTNWIVQPAPAPAEPVRVESGDSVLRQTLHPEGAARLLGDVQHGTGEDDLLPDGSLLYLVNSPVAVVYCGLNLAEISTLNRIFLDSSNNQRCLVDADKDGSFESAFNARSPIEGLPIVNSRLPENRRAVEPPVAYEVVSPEAVGDNYWVEIEYQGRPLLYNRRNFGIQYGNAESDQRLSSWQYVSGEEFPASLSMMGATFTVLSEDESGLLIRIDRTMPRRAFSVIQTVTYGY